MGKQQEKPDVQLLIGTVLLGLCFSMWGMPSQVRATELSDPPVTPWDRVEIKNEPQKTVIVGETGKINFDFHSVGGIKTTGVMNFGSSDPNVLSIDQNGKWQALKAGKIYLSYDPEYSSETEQAILNKFGDYYIQDIGKVPSEITVLAASVPVYRLYNPNSGEHFYTKTDTEKAVLVKAGWQTEGISWQSYTKGTPVYRLYNPNAGDHHYTENKNEVQFLVSQGWRDEGVSFNAANVKKQAVYRLYNPNAKEAGAHHYTKLLGERNNLVKAGWQAEGIAWYDE